MYILKVISKGLVALSILSIVVAAPVFGFGTGGKTAKQPQISSLPTKKDNAAEMIPNKIVIKFKDRRNFGKQLSSTGLASVDNSLKKNNITELEQFIRGTQNLINLNSSISIESIYYAYFTGDESPASVARALNENPLVEYAEPLYYHQLFDTPNDTLFDQQGFFDVIQAEQAWEVVKGEQGNVVIAIVDGGTDIDHPDISANLWVNPGETPSNGIDDDGNGFVDDVNGWNFVNNSNDPTGLTTTPQNADHGTHTAGLASAVTNNVTGVSGVSWNTRLMALNAGSPNTDLTITFGYEAIIYAANNGADVINLSWGRQGGPSIFEQEVINMATELGAAIVAAAGNDNNTASGFPSAYENVLSVAATTNSDFKAGFSNYGSTIDIAAPGSSIFSTLNNGRYGNLSGTSFSSPIVAGVVGLVKTKNPDLLGIQASEQVRITADNIDDLNPAFATLLGSGRVNAFRAVTETSPSIRITDVQFNDGNGDGIIEPGETVDVVLSLQNFLAPASNVNLTLNTDDSFSFLTNANVNLSTIGTMEEVTLTTPFTFSVLSFAPSGHPIDFTLEISSDNYQDLDRFTLTVLPTFGTASVNNIKVTVTNIGRIGFADSDNSGNGIGFKFQDGPNLLFEGALITGTSPSQISNAARGVLIGNDLLFDDDFSVAQGGDLQIITPGAISDQESIGIFEDTAADIPMNIRITQETFAMGTSPNDNFILIRYNVENQGSNTLSNFHFGIFYDWDIDGGSFSTNRVDYDSARKLGYAFDTGNGPDTYVGMSVLTDGGVSYRAIFNDQNDPSNPSWGIYDGFTDAEKWEAISGGIEFTQAGPADVSHVIATGPFTIEANSFSELGFALVAGVDLNDLQANADAAKSLWEELFVTAVEDDKPVLPTEFSLNQNYPNPFNPTTAIRYELAEVSDVELTIYNMLGQKIRTLVKERQSAGFYSMQWDGKNDAGQQVASGVYLYKLDAGDFSRTKKMILLR